MFDRLEGETHVALRRAMREEVHFLRTFDMESGAPGVDVSCTDPDEVKAWYAHVVIYISVRTSH